MKFTPNIAAFPITTGEFVTICALLLLNPV